ncbi:MAG TPA: hypothetical protein VIL89_05500 [Clostridia bacterium]
MKKEEQKHIILKNSFNISYHIYFDEERGLCLRMLDDERVWSRAFILSDLSVNDFCAAIDDRDIIHFVFQAKDGRILYGHGRRGHIDIQPILGSKDTTPWHKNVSLLVFEDTILFFYVIRHNDRHLISMQSIIKGALSKPMAIDYIDGSDKHYLVIRDRLGKYHLFYCRSEKSGMSLYHRVLKEEQNIFTAAEKLYESEGDILFPSAVCGKDNRIYLAFQDHRDGISRVLFKKLGMTEPLILYNSQSPAGRSGLVYNNGVLFLYRVDAQNIYYRTSNDEGINWTDETRLSSGYTGMTCRFIYNTNMEKERSLLCFNEIPGSFSKGYQLAFLNEEPEQRITAVKSAEKVDSTIDKILPVKKPSDSKSGKSGSLAGETPANNLDNKIIRLKNFIESMQKELTKLWLTQKECDKKLEELREEIDILKQNFDYLSKYVYGDEQI